MITPGLFSSASNDWETPLDVFEALNTEFHFTLDPCATDENHKCRRYYTKEQNGLTKSWNGERVYCNPPYGREIAAWVKKSYEESRSPDTTVVMLVPARTDTRWFHDYIYGRAEVRFLRGRIRFLKQGKPMKAAPFPSMIVVFN